MLSVNQPTVVLYYWDETNRGFYQHHIQQVLEELGMQGVVHGVEESYLERGVLANSQPLPSKTIVITHGNVPTQHQNVGFVRHLASRRKDLQFIVSLDENELLREKFDSEEDWQYVRDKLEEEFTSGHQVTLVRYVLPTFFGGHDRRGNPIDQNFNSYMIAWKALQEGKP